MKRYLLQLLTVGLLLTGVIACEMDMQADENSNDNTRLIAVETIQVVPDAFDDYIRVSGVVEAIEDATISAESSGRILSIAARGAQVGEGEVIAQMDDRLMRAQYEAAQTSFNLAEDSYNRLQALHEESIISTQDFQSAAAQRDQARAQLDQAEKQLRDARIEAPFRGRVEERFVQTGELISPGMPVVRLVNTDVVRITAGIPERYSGQITEGTPVNIRFRSYDGSNRESSISFAGNVIDSSTRTFPVEIEFGNEEGDIRPEMVVDLQIRRRTIENAIIIPRTAIIRDESGTHVFVAREENGSKISELVAVRPGLASGAIIEIHEGLEEGDEVVISGISSLSAGDRLNILSTEESHVKARELQQRDRPAVTN